MTNGDKIRNMTNEELADFLVSEDVIACTHCEFYNGEVKRCYLDNPCVKVLASTEFVYWLYAEAGAAKN